MKYNLKDILLRASRIIQIIFSILGLLACVFSFGLALMVSASALGSEYPKQALGAGLFLLTFIYAFLIFLISIFKPYVFVGLFLVPILFFLSQYFENSTYNISHKIIPIHNHSLIGKELKFDKKVYLKSNLPKKRLRNYSTLCLHDFKLTDSNDGLVLPKVYWQKGQPPETEVLEPPQSFTVIDAFECGRMVKLSLKDPDGRLIEMFEFEID